MEKCVLVVINRRLCWPLEWTETNVYFQPWYTSTIIKAHRRVAMRIDRKLALKYCSTSRGAHHMKQGLKCCGPIQVVRVHRVHIWLSYWSEFGEMVDSFSRKGVSIPIMDRSLPCFFFLNNQRDRAFELYRRTNRLLFFSTFFVQPPINLSVHDAGQCTERRDEAMFSMGVGSIFCLVLYQQESCYERSDLCLCWSCFISSHLAML